MTATVEIAGITGEAVNPVTVEIARVTGRAVGAGSLAARVLIAGVTGFATGGDLPSGYVQIGGVHGFARNPAPIPGRSLLHMWDGTKLNPVTPMVWNGVGLEKT